MTLRTIKVYPNAYGALDSSGRPRAALPYEPTGDGVTTFDARRFVGATLKTKVLEKFPRGDARESVQENTFEFSDQETTLPATTYYLDALRRGELLPADEDTARTAGIKFADPAELLEFKKKDACDVWAKRNHAGCSDKVPECLAKHRFGPMKVKETKPTDSPSGDKGNKGGKS